MHNTVHFVLQGKGGIGKSFVSTLLAQYFAGEGAELICFDTDQENTTFAHYKALNVSHVAVMDESRVVDAKKFDALMEDLLTKEGTFVIDTGANTFSNLLAYIVENDVIGLLQENERKVFIHTIVGGGDTLLDTANGFNSIAQGVDASLVLWMNEHFGKMKTDDGKDFTETKVFKNHQSKLTGVVMLHARNLRHRYCTNTALKLIFTAKILGNTVDLLHEHCHDAHQVMPRGLLHGEKQGCKRSAGASDQ